MDITGEPRAEIAILVILKDAVEHRIEKIEVEIKQLLKNNKRIFGIDNTKNWHIYPFEDPESHIETTSISLLDFLEMLVSNKDKW